jgi:hypothetical protein
LVARFDISAIVCFASQRKPDMFRFTEWLSQTSISLAIQTHLWIIPLIQSIHIVAIGIVMGSVLMIGLRILGLAGLDQTILETVSRFAPPLYGALCVAVVTGIFMVMGEPARDLMSFSFWAKMTLLAAATITLAAFKLAVGRNAHRWQEVLVNRWTTKSVAILMLLIWAGITVLGRLIAYDSIWGAWSHVPKD